MKSLKNNYTVAKSPDVEVYEKYCRWAESLNDSRLTDEIIDVDGSQIRIYTVENSPLRVILDYDIGYTAVESDISLDSTIPGYLLKY